MALMPGAQQRPVRNRSVNAMGTVRGMVEHHMVGSDESAEARFNDPGSSASAHFGVDLDGTIYQYVDTKDAAWHACQANYSGWVGIENESPGQDDPSTPQNELWDPLTQEQVTASGRILRWLHDEHGVPIQVTDNTVAGGVAYHSMNPGACNAAWGLTGCPGPLVVFQRDEVVRVALGAAVGPPVDWAAIAAYLEGQDMVKLIASISHPEWGIHATDGRGLWHIKKAEAVAELRAKGIVPNSEPILLNDFAWTALVNYDK